MKKMLLFVSIGFIATLVFSCNKKDYTCTCTVVSTGNPPYIVPLGIKNSTESNAKSTCDGYVTTYGALYPGATVTCKL